MSAPLPARLRTRLLPMAAGLGALAAAAIAAVAAVPDAAPAAAAVNALGVDLLRTACPRPGNALISPYSIQSALAMAYAGAAGRTRSEMARVLHDEGGDDARLHGSFHALAAALERTRAASVAEVEARVKRGGPAGDPVSLTVVNRLFGQSGYAFRAPFLNLLKDAYDAPFEPMDFIHHAAEAAPRINRWVEDNTRRRIRNLIPDGALDRTTRLVLVNAVHLKAPWLTPFPEAGSRPEPFELSDGRKAEVPTMTVKTGVAYGRRDECTVLALPYAGGDLQFLILLPDQRQGLASLELSLDRAQLSAAGLARREVTLHLPKFKMEPPTMSLSRGLQALGMKTAFDIPAGSADFDRMAPRRADDRLFISDVFHKTFLSLDEKGTEAAAATAVVMAKAMAIVEGSPNSIEVRVDHPFLFAIQHRPSGACLFLGRVEDPR